MQYNNRIIAAIIQMSYAQYYYPFLDTDFDLYEIFRSQPPKTEQTKCQYVKSEEIAKPIEKIERKLPFKRKGFLTNLKKYLKSYLHYSSCYKKMHWTFQDDELLKKLVDVDKVDWKEVPRYFKDRTQNMCYGRYRRLKNDGKSKKWTKKDQENVIALVKQYGEKWKTISRKLPKGQNCDVEFTPKQIRSRYFGFIQTQINKPDFTLKEDYKICKFFLQDNINWKDAQILLPGRTKRQIKYRYFDKLRKIMKKIQSHRDIQY